jgi:hypothetical protein
MALRSKTFTKPNGSEEPAEEVISQHRRPEGRFLLQVDRQTKVSFSTFGEAEKAGLVIKKNFPIVRVAVYDSSHPRTRSSTRRKPDLVHPQWR